MHNSISFNQRSYAKWLQPSGWKLRAHVYLKGSVSGTKRRGCLLPPSAPLLLIYRQLETAAGRSQTLCQRAGGQHCQCSRKTRGPQTPSHATALTRFMILLSLISSLEMVRAQQDFFPTFSRRTLGSTHFWLYFQVQSISRHPSQAFRGRKTPKNEVISVTAHPLRISTKTPVNDPNLLSSSRCSAFWIEGLLSTPSRLKI